MKRKVLLPQFSFGSLLFILLLVSLLIDIFPSLLKTVEADPRLVLSSFVIIVLFLVMMDFRNRKSRLQRLSIVADSIGQGNYQSRSDDKTKDSLGTLAVSVNQMAEKIQISISEQEDAQINIEDSRAKLEEQNRELSLAVERQEEFSEFLSNIASIDINTIADTAMGYLMAISNSQFGLFYIFDDEKKELVLISQKSVDQKFLRSFIHDELLKKLPQELMSKKKWINIDDMDANTLPEINLGFTKAKLRNIFGIPVLFQDKYLGSVILAGLGKVDTATRQHISNHIEVLANSLVNATTYQSVQNQSVQLEDANQELLVAHKQKSEFVANMSHELRTPLIP